MKRMRFTALALLAAVVFAANPVQAKKSGSEGGSVPKGVQKKVANGGELPPGWQKKLRKGEVLDQSVVDHGKPVSPALKVKLPVGKKGSIDISLDGKIVRLDKATRKVLDVFELKL